jgi:cytoskeletal protein CcmA (bactofilin family)
MSNQLQEDGSFINSIVGEGTSFRGDLELNGLLRIDGDFSGTIRTAGKVLVGVNGRAECTINAGTVVIGGVVKGNIFAMEKVLVLSTGMMIGNINTPRLIAEEGVVLHGACLVQLESENQLDKDSMEDTQTTAVPQSEATSISAPETIAQDADTEASEQTVLSTASEGEIGTWNG